MLVTNSLNCQKSLTKKSHQHNDSATNILKLSPSYSHQHDTRMLYRELNKIRKTPLSYGCAELLDGIAQKLGASKTYFTSFNTCTACDQCLCWWYYQWWNTLEKAETLSPTDMYIIHFFQFLDQIFDWKLFHVTTQRNSHKELSIWVIFSLIQWIPSFGSIRLKHPSIALRTQISNW